MNNDNNSLERRIVFFSIQNGQAPFPLGWGWLYYGTQKIEGINQDEVKTVTDDFIKDSNMVQYKQKNRD
jgi:hypothetical protein